MSTRCFRFGIEAATANFLPSAVFEHLGTVELTVRWGDTVQNFADFTAFGDDVPQGSISIGTIFPQAGEWQDLVFSWSGLDDLKDNRFAATVAAIPLPAAGWLLLTALGGISLAARRRRDKTGARGFKTPRRRRPPTLPGPEAAADCKNQ